MKQNLLILMLTLWSFVCLGQEQFVELETTSKRIDQLPTSSGWTGATLIQNFDGNGAESIVGGGFVRINTAPNLNGSFRLNVVGNLASISKALNTEDLSSNLVRIGQSAQGLALGFEPEYIFIEKKNHINLLNIYSHLLYKVNDFQNINNTTDHMVLSQFRSSIGFSIEAIEFNEGDFITLSVEGIRSGFSADRYETIFGNRKSSIYSLEITGVVPLFWRMGLLLGQNYTKGASGVFSAGLVVKYD